MPLRLLTILVFAVGFYFLLPMAVYASETVISGAMCNVVSWFSGKTGRALVVLAMIITGVMALLNKISWNIALVHLVGEALVLEASIMVSNIAAGGEDC